MRVDATIRFPGPVARVADRAYALPGEPSIDGDNVLWLDGRRLGVVSSRTVATDVERQSRLKGGRVIHSARVVATTVDVAGMELPTPAPEPDRCPYCEAPLVGFDHGQCLERAARGERP